MATIYKYRNISGRNYVHLPDGTLIDPGQARWTYHNMAGNPSLELVESKDDGKPTVTEAMVADAVADYIENHPEAFNSAIAAYLEAHPSVGPVGGDPVEEKDDDN